MRHATRFVSAIVVAIASPVASQPIGVPGGPPNVVMECFTEDKPSHHCAVNCHGASISHGGIERIEIFDGNETQSSDTWKWMMVREVQVIQNEFRTITTYH